MGTAGDVIVVVVRVLAHGNFTAWLSRHTAFALAVMLAGIFAVGAITALSAKHRPLIVFHIRFV